MTAADFVIHPRLAGHRKGIFIPSQNTGNLEPGKCDVPTAGRWICSLSGKTIFSKNNLGLCGLERELKLKRALVGAMIYPAIILCLVVVAVVIVVTVIVPRVLSSVEGQIVSMPLPTRIVQGMATFFGDWWWLVAMDRRRK